MTIPALPACLLPIFRQAMRESSHLQIQGDKFSWLSSTPFRLLKFGVLVDRIRLRLSELAERAWRAALFIGA